MTPAERPTSPLIRWGAGIAAGLLGAAVTGGWKMLFTHDKQIAVQEQKLCEMREVVTEIRADLRVIPEIHATLKEMQRAQSHHYSDRDGR